MKKLFVLLIVLLFSAALSVSTMYAQEVGEEDPVVGGIIGVYLFDTVSEFEKISEQFYREFGDRPEMGVYYIPPDGSGIYLMAPPADMQEVETVE